MTNPASGFFTWILGIFAAVLATLRLRGFSFTVSSVCFRNANGDSVELLLFFQCLLFACV